MRRLAVLLAVVASLSIAAAPAMAATTTIMSGSSLGLNAKSSDERFDGGGNLLPGTYIEAVVSGSTGVSVVDHVSSLEDYVCAFYLQFTQYETGGGTDWAVFGCATPDTLTINPGLLSGRLVASFPATRCDYGTGECVAAGTFAVDVTATGDGKVMTSGYGGQNCHEPPVVVCTANARYHFRSADVAGSLTLNGVSVLVGGAWTSGDLNKYEGGSRVTFPHG
jgi:hypothetical protein